MQDFKSFEEFLLRSVWGVITLGAIGSIAGAVIIFVIGRIANYFKLNTVELFNAFFYRYLKSNESASNLSINQQPSEDAKYIIYAITELADLLMSTVCLTVILSTLIIISVLTGLDHPYVLACLIAGMILLINAWLHSLASLAGFIDDKIYENHKTIIKNLPATYQSWKSYLGKNAGRK
ncbi:hypothetical protein ACQV5M_15965 [Leptospira sp. SA-E8]|uniref:hypothetical protein n=1 Tax=Leptospira sp. SA-E8 TaxID=3422259 RepID=UPI003EBD2792